MYRAPRSPSLARLRSAASIPRSRSDLLRLLRAWTSVRARSVSSESRSARASRSMCCRWLSCRSGSGEQHSACALTNAMAVPQSRRCSAARACSNHSTGRVSPSTASYNIVGAVADERPPGSDTLCLSNAFGATSESFPDACTAHPRPSAMDRCRHGAAQPPGRRPRRTRHPPPAPSRHRVPHRAHRPLAPQRPKPALPEPRRARPPAPCHRPLPLGYCLS